MAMQRARARTADLEHELEIGFAALRELKQENDFLTQRLQEKKYAHWQAQNEVNPLQPALLHRQWNPWGFWPSIYIYF